MTIKKRLDADMKRLHVDTVLLAARELSPLILEAFAASPPRKPRVRSVRSFIRSGDVVGAASSTPSMPRSSRAR